jgi:stage II sporulation protein D
VKRFWAAAVLCVLGAACFGPPSRPTFPPAGFDAARHVRVRYSEHGAQVVRDVPLEEYVAITALSELAPAAGDDQMLEVQAIISRTYAVAHIGRHNREGFDLCATTHCQLFEPGRLQTSRWAAAAAEAVRQTAGVILTFQAAPVQAVYHADCGGRTSAASAVWGGGGRAYLLSRRDDGPAGNAHTSWQFRVTRDALGNALQTSTSGSTPDLGVTGSLESVEVTERDEAGRAREVVARWQPLTKKQKDHSVCLRGDDFRNALTRAFGARAIRSTLFEIDHDAKAFTFTGRGFGHGVGLCQAGALARLRRGATPAEVLEYYYPGTTLDRGPSPRHRR